MDLKFIDRVIKTTLLSAALLFPFFAIYVRMNFALSVLFGAAWGTLNLLGIRLIITNLLVPQKPNWILGLIILFLKMPVLYFLGYLLLTWDYMSIGGLLWGFSGILIVAVLKALSRTILGLEKKEEPANRPQPSEIKA